MNDTQACCAHCKVVLKHKDYPDGTRSDYWECADGCGTMFWPSTVSEQLKTIAEHNQNKYLHAVGIYEDEIARLKRGDFTKEEFQNLCHNRHEKEGYTAQDFFNGCAEYQKSLFGTSERETKTPPQHNHGGEPAPASSAQREELNQ